MRNEVGKVLGVTVILQDVTRLGFMRIEIMHNATLGCLESCSLQRAPIADSRHTLRNTFLAMMLH